MATGGPVGRGSETCFPLGGCDATSNHEWPTFYMLPELPTANSYRKSDADASFDRDCVKKVSSVNFLRVRKAAVDRLGVIYTSAYKELSGMIRSLLTAKVAIHYYTTLNMANGVLSGLRLIQNFHHLFIDEKMTRSYKEETIRGLLRFSQVVNNVVSLSRKMGRLMEWGGEESCKPIEATLKMLEEFSRTLRETYQGVSEGIVKLHKKRNIEIPTKEDLGEYWASLSSHWFTIVMETRNVPYPRLLEPLRFMQVYQLDREAIRVSEYRLNLSTDIWSNVIFLRLFNADQLCRISSLTFSLSYTPRWEEHEVEDRFTGWNERNLEKERQLAMDFEPTDFGTCKVSLKIDPPRRQSAGEILSKCPREASNRDIFWEYIDCGRYEGVIIKIENESIAAVSHGTKRKSEEDSDESGRGSAY